MMIHGQYSHSRQNDMGPFMPYRTQLVLSAGYQLHEYMLNRKDVRLVIIHDFGTEGLSVVIEGENKREIEDRVFEVAKQSGVKRCRVTVTQPPLWWRLRNKYFPSRSHREIQSIYRP